MNQELKEVTGHLCDITVARKVFFYWQCKDTMIDIGFIGAVSDSSSIESASRITRKALTRHIDFLNANYGGGEGMRNFPFSCQQIHAIRVSTEVRAIKKRRVRSDRPENS